MGFPKIENCMSVISSTLGTDSFLPLFPQCWIRVLHKNEELFTVVMLVLCGVGKAQRLCVTCVPWGSLAATVCLSWDELLLSLFFSYFLSNLSTLTTFYIKLVTWNILPSQWFSELQWAPSPGGITLSDRPLEFGSRFLAQYSVFWVTTWSWSMV